jgi:protein-S-isoprenylcysteine O-methyltransferase Ste14
MPTASDHAPVRVAAPFIYAGFIGLTLLLHLLLPLPAPLPGIIRAVGSAAVFGGLVLGILAVVRMRRAQTSVSPHQPTTRLVTDGPFRFTRNPIYLGFFFIFLGFTFLAGTLWGIVLAPLVPVTVNRLVIRPEESYLHGKFADHYAEYKSRVRRWI